MITQLRQLALFAVVATSGAGCSFDIEAGSPAATGSFERTLAVSGAVDLDVQTGAGSVVVRRGEDAMLHVTGQIRVRQPLLRARNPEETVRALEENPPIRQDGNAVHLGPFGEEELRHVSISYELAVPANTSVRVRTGSGRIEIPALHGHVEARTGSGRIALGPIRGAVVAETGSGPIEVLGAGGGLSARTGSGSILGQDLSGPVQAVTGSGRIEIRFAGAGDADLETGSGRIDVAGIDGGLRVHTGSGSVTVDGAPSAPWALRAGPGSITLRLPPDAAFALEARSNNGSVQTSHPLLTFEGSQRSRLEGQVRGGGARIALSTGSGAIRVD
jgi:hypothetical protein